MRKVFFMAATVVATMSAVACIAGPAWAANLSGHKVLQVQGAATNDSSTDKKFGSLTLTGLIDFDGKGGASSVHVTLGYNSQERPDTGIVCRMNTPTDVTAADFDATGVGTLTLKISATDSCFEADDLSPTKTNESGKSITFDLYRTKNGSAHIASTGSTLETNFGEAINDVNAVGSLEPAP